MDKMNELYSGMFSNTFVKTEKVSEDSNYYCLWIDQHSFYLYNGKTEYFALKTNVISNAHLFSRIEDYSENTKSFVAYRSDENLAYIMYEDGYVAEFAFRYVGKEYNGMRPVMANSGKWAFYDVRNRKRHWFYGREKEFIYSFDRLEDRRKNNSRLDRLFANNYFTICTDNCCCYAHYNKDKHKFDYSENMDSIECVSQNYLVGKLQNKNLYVLQKMGDAIEPIGYYMSRPRYVEEYHLYVAKTDDDCWCIVRGSKEIRNYQWKNDCFAFEGEYIFNKLSEQTSWRIYDKNGHDVSFDWKNIRIYRDNGFYMLVDTEEGENQKKTIADIQERWNELIQKSKQCYSNTPSINANNEPRQEEAPVIKKKREKENVKVLSTVPVSNRVCENRLPERIDYCTAIDNVRWSKDFILRGNVVNRKCSHLSKGEYICWLIKEGKAIAISEYIRPKTYKVCYYSECEAGIWERLKLPSRFVRVNLDKPQDSILPKQLLEVLNGAKENRESILDEKRQKVRDWLKQEGFGQPQIDTAIETLFEKYEFVKCEQTDLTKANFMFEDKNYSLSPDDVWNITNVFKKRRFLIKTDIIVVLVDMQRAMDGRYKLIGEGNDKRFDQDFVSPTNRAIRDNSKRILLFRRDERGQLLFCDEVKCEGYSMIFQDEFSNRKLILFSLYSVLK